MLRLLLFTVMSLALGVTHLDGEDSTPEFRKAQGDDDTGVRVAAIKALGENGKAAIPELRKALRDENLSVQLAAIEILCTMGKDAIPELQTALRDESKFVRNTAINALARTGREAVPLLREELADQENWQPAQSALEEIHGSAYVYFFRAMILLTMIGSVWLNIYLSNLEIRWWRGMAFLVCLTAMFANYQLMTLLFWRVFPFPISYLRAGLLSIPSLIVLVADPFLEFYESISSGTGFGSNGSGTRADKHCSSCNRRVSTWARAGECCPHCGARWSYESSQAGSSGGSEMSTRAVLSILTVITFTAILLFNWW